MLFTISSFIFIHVLDHRLLVISIHFDCKELSWLDSLFTINFLLSKFIILKLIFSFKLQSLILFNRVLCELGHFADSEKSSFSVEVSHCWHRIIALLVVHEFGVPDVLLAPKLGLISLNRC